MKTRLRQPVALLVVLLAVGGNLFSAGCGKKEEAQQTAPQNDAAQQKKDADYAKDMARQGGAPSQ